MPWCRRQGGRDTDPTTTTTTPGIRRIKKRPGQNDLWDCACQACGTGTAGIHNPMSNYETNNGHDCHMPMITNVVVGTETAVIRKVPKT